MAGGIVGDSRGTALGNLAVNTPQGVLPTLGGQQTQQSNSGGNDAWGIASQALGGIGTLVDMFLKINSAVKSVKARKRAEARDTPTLGQAQTQIPMLGR